MRVAVQRQISEIVERLLAPLGVHFAGESISTQYLNNFEVEYMRGVQRIVPAEQSLGYPGRRRCVEQHFEKG